MNMQEEIDSILLARGFKGIRVQGIDFSAFSTTEVDIVHAPELKGLESDTSRLWRSFAKGIIKGSIDPNGELPQSLEEIDPDILAQVMNQQFEDTGVSSEASYEQAITSFLQKSDQENIRDQAHQESIGRLGSLVGKLKPEIRRQFLNSTFKSCANRPGTAENLLSHMPREVLLDALDQVDAGSIEIPQSLLDVVGKLSKHGADGVSTSRVAGNVGRSTQETAQQLASLFSEDRSEFFVPKDYQDALAAMTAATADQFLTDGQVDELVSSLDTHAVEKQFCNVLLDLLERDVPLEIGDAIGRNLLAIMDYFLETGDFVSLARVHNSLTRHVLTLPEGVSESSHEALAYFSSEDFIDRVLDSFEVWGEPSQSAINSLVREAGHLFADAMLERLADEPKMARRRHYMELLVRVGAAVIEPIEARIDDPRWYFVRNMVLILRALKDPAAIKVLRGLTKHENAKVRIEVVKSLLELRDEQGHRVLYEALMDKDPLVLS
ncbi:MAG: HEAT repeat domain-containing protein, partial [Gammaproteobacteria bacterium]|nr:HEAT repeat domain-containing protein [Gammaproteobacteria bacterium]